MSSLPSFVSPPRQARGVGRARSRALALLLHRGRHGVRGGGRRAGPRRVRKDVHLRDPGASTTSSVRANARSSSPGKPTITSVVRLNVARAARAGAGTSRPCSGGPSPRARRRRPTGAARAGGGATVGVSRNAATSSRVDVVHLDRGQAQARQPGDRAGLADEPRQREPRAVAEAAEVDPGEHDLRWPCSTRRRISRAPRSAARLREAPRTSGMTQKLHEKLQPSWIFTNARTRSSRASACTQPIAPTSPATNAGVSSLAARRRRRSPGSPRTRPRRGSRRSR